MEIRSWRAEDLPQVTALLAELDDALGETQEVGLADVERQFRLMEADPATYASFVCEEDGSIKGFISLLFYRSVYHREGTAQINELVVARDSRGRGIGKALLGCAAAIARSRNMDEIEVGVMKDNEKAIRFYKSHGLDEEYLLLGKEFGD
jgi:ribosomal protein S18 acetylase RimI-like enzyme